MKQTLVIGVKQLMDEYIKAQEEKKSQELKRLTTTILEKIENVFSQMLTKLNSLSSNHT